MDTTQQDEKQFDMNKMTPEQYKLMIDKMVNGFALHKIIVDENGKPVDYIFLDINPAFETKTGLKESDIIGKKVTEVLPGTENDPENWIGKYGEVALGGESITFEAYSANLKKWYLISAYSPQKYYFIVMMKDISELKIKESILIDNEQRLKSILEIVEFKTDNIQEFLDFALDKAINLTKSKIGYIYFYDESTKLFTLNSWSKDVMDVCKIQEKKTVYPLDSTGLWGEVVRQRKQIMINDFNLENPLKKGYPEGHAPLKNFLSIPIFINEKIVAVVGVGNKETNYFENDMLQLTLLMESVWKNVQAKESESSLTQAENKFKLYFDKSPQGIFVIDDKSIILDVNPMLTDRLGITKDELIGKSSTSYLLPEFIEQAKVDLIDIIDKGYKEGRFAFSTKDGSRIDITYKATRISDNSFIVFCDDITKELNTIRELEQSNFEMKRLNSVMIARETKMIELKEKLKELGVDPAAI